MYAFQQILPSNMNSWVVGAPQKGSIGILGHDSSYHNLKLDKKNHHI